MDFFGWIFSVPTLGRKILDLKLFSLYDGLYTKNQVFRPIFKGKLYTTLYFTFMGKTPLTPIEGGGGGREFFTVPTPLLSFSILTFLAFDSFRANFFPYEENFLNLGCKK